MNKTQQLIMKAIEGGWDAPGIEFDVYSRDGKTKHSNRHYTLHTAQHIAQMLKYDAVVVPYVPKGFNTASVAQFI